MTETFVVNTSPGPAVAASSPSDNGNSTEGTSSLQNEAGLDNTPPRSSPNGDGSSTARPVPPPKTDKPRPHMCATCERAFARLEHLKRHERSHTKEKPFECENCSRSFARRDLLLRHQQKLHQTGTTSTSKRGNRRDSSNRRESAGSATAAKVRKNSITGTARPRANTISSVDRGHLNMLAAANRNVANQNASADSKSPPDGTNTPMKPRGMAAASGNHGNPQGLPRLATHNLQSSSNEALRTAPPGPNMGTFGMNFPAGYGSTINPAQLHMNEPMPYSGSPFNSSTSPFTPQPVIMEDENDTDLMQGFTQMSFDGSALQSPPPFSDSSQGMGNIDPNQLHHSPFNAGSSQMSLPPMTWSDTNTVMPSDFTPGQPLGTDANDVSNFQSFAPMPDTISPGTLHAQQFPPTDNPFPFPMMSPMATLNPQSPFQDMQGQFQPQMNFSSDGTTGSSPANTRQSSVTSVSTESITDLTRQALVLSLSQPTSGFHTRTHSQPTMNSHRSQNSQEADYDQMLPSTSDLQRFVSAYIQFFHPHFPFLHIPTLSFDAPAYTSNLQHTPNNPGGPYGGVVGGGGCLILAMAAIGALYEFDRTSAQVLFDAAKRMIHSYLEGRKKASRSYFNGSTQNNEVKNAPLWLVQAMLLNVVYGHNCGEKTAGDIASTHCTALIGLARSANLTGPLSESEEMDLLQRGYQESSRSGDVAMANGFGAHNFWITALQDHDEEGQWRRWIIREERKRTLFAIFHMSSLLLSAYNHAPALMNSEIQLDLPCEEELWTAENARVWASKQSMAQHDGGSTPFATALHTLLSASQKQPEHQRGWQFRGPFGSGVQLSDLPPSDLKLSTFGCLVLINALHNYIWETRQRHSGRPWTTQETESMIAHIEPALRAWHSAWASNPTHSLERPNPYGCGPLSADSMPLLDLAYVRVFINFGKSKEAFWQRDFVQMAEELARGSEIVQHAEHSGNTPDSTNSMMDSQSPSDPMNHSFVALTQDPTNFDGMNQQRDSSKRERHLRKAAYYAADSLATSHNLGVTFAEFTSRELPVQSALCTFDCAQILAEWVSMVQERVGRYLGVILGQDPVDFTQVPAVMFLENEDIQLLEKIHDIIAKAESKIVHEIKMLGGNSSATLSVLNNLPSRTHEGYGPKILKVTAFMMERAAVWAVTALMSQALQVQAGIMNERANMSLNA